MEQLKHMKEMLTSCVQGQMSNLQAADTKELGDAIDMIKDLAEAIYYCSISEAMEESKKEKDYSPKYYTMVPPMYDRDMDRHEGRMYFDSSFASRGGYDPSMRGNNARGGGTRGYHEFEYPIFEAKDMREGRSGERRRTYMEAKEMRQGKEVKLKELERYLQELSHDITEMIDDASPEEKQMLRQKMATLASKIDG